MHRKFSVAFAAIITCLFVWSPASPANGQTAPDKDSAEFAFEIRMDQLRGTPLYEMISGPIEEWRENEGVPSEVDVEKVNRIWGAVQFPETVADMEAMDNMEPGDKLPMELFVQIEFADSESADAAMKMILEDTEEITKDGKKYFGPKAGGDAPSNLIGHKLNATTIEAGTEGYIMAGAGKSLFSKGLGTAWDSFSDEPIRLAVDLDNARQLINEALEQAKTEAPPMMHGMLDLVNMASHLRLSIDLKDGGNLLAIGASGTDEEAAESLRTGLDGMLGMAKMMGGGAVEQMREQDEGMADVMAAILQSLNAERDGTDVQIVIPKPEGFEDAIKSMMERNGAGGDF